MSYLGIPPFGRTVRTVTESIATAGQTTFYPNGGYAIGYVDVSINGITLLTTDYTATDGSSVVLNSAAAVNDEVKFTSYTVGLIPTSSLPITLNSGSTASVSVANGYFNVLARDGSTQTKITVT